ncbi:hypothetical protein OG243_26590 [Streptomyces sp. NBC_01318]|uniref:hypothetical protein n=1 Tax=Streptomyces sp. NBC_01318 TaxID=2903823 RepID=UPI002E12664F|nr:hypothetical protein OG243_26590 [Streptomyces sp. NBC_01318]
MALPPLATVADLTARGIPVDDADLAGIYLDTASSLIRAAAGHAISQTTATVVLDGTCTTRLRLPGDPVTAVHGVVMDEVPVTDYRLSAGYLIHPAGWFGDAVEVTYTYGLPAVPADIVDMVCRLTAQALTGDPGARAIRSERIGDYSVTYSDAETGTMSLSDSQRRRIAARFGSSLASVRAI